MGGREGEGGRKKKGKKGEGGRERGKGKGKTKGGRESDTEGGRVMEGMKYMHFEHCVSELKTK